MVKETQCLVRGDVPPVRRNQVTLIIADSLFNVKRKDGLENRPGFVLKKHWTNVYAPCYNKCN